MASAIILTAVYGILSIITFLLLYKMVNRQRNLEQNVQDLKKKMIGAEANPEL